MGRFLSVCLSRVTLNRRWQAEEAARATQDDLKGALAEASAARRDAERWRAAASTAAAEAEAGAAAAAAAAGNVADAHQELRRLQAAAAEARAAAHAQARCPNGLCRKGICMRAHLTYGGLASQAWQSVLSASGMLFINAIWLTSREPSTA